MTKFEDLVIWKNSIHFAKDVFLFCSRLNSQYKFSLGDQLRRSSLSISSNIAEGSGSTTTKEELRYVGIALKSAFESLSQLYFAKEIGLKVEDLIKVNLILIKQIQAYKKSKLKYL